jgi:hypothetical protein
MNISFYKNINFNINVEQVENGFIVDNNGKRSIAATKEQAIIIAEAAVDDQVANLDIAGITAELDSTVTTFKTELTTL